MARKPNSELKNESGVYKSQLRASKRYNKKVDSILVRVPVGYADKIKTYVANSDKYTSVNAMICDLIRQEIGED